MFIDKVKKIIDTHDVISFDIFDTLLLRPYIRPTDMFQHLEKVYHKPCFFVCRTEAEENARLLHPGLEDVTFDMIYDEIDDEFKDMKQKELDWEEMILRANPELKRVYNYAKQQGKKIVIASDMYLPTDFITKVLRKNGYDDWDKLYVSADVNARKGNGSMFRQIMSDLKVSANQILHIGDNKISDYKVPQKLKIKAVKYEPIYQQFKKQNKRYLAMDPKTTATLGGSIMFSVFAYDWIMKKCKQKAETNNYWFDLGYLYAGPASYGYTRFVEKQAIKNDIDFLLFVARDGYLLQKVFKTFNSKIANSYVYAPRVLNHLCRLDYIRSIPEQAQYIIDFYAQKSPEIKKLSKQITNPHELIQQHKEIFGKLAHEQMEKYRHYLHKNIKNSKKYASIDTITGSFSSQKILQDALQTNVLGIYWGICQDEFVNKYNHKTFVGEHTTKSAISDKYFYTLKWNFMEFLITSPEFPIKNIDDNGKPIYSDNISPSEKRRAELYPNIVRGALNFANEIKDWFKGNDIYLEPQDIISWINAYLQNPTSVDIKQMQGLNFAEGSAHKDWIPLLVSDYGFKDFIRIPKKAEKTLHEAMWRTPLQSLFLCFRKPLSFRMRSLRRISLTLFPYLRKQYGGISLVLNNQWFYKFIIGNMKG